jgi:hypothetical protein
VSIHRNQLQSGRVSYTAYLRKPDGSQYKKTFRTRKEAEAFIVQERSTRLQGTWVDPRAGNARLEEFATTWLAQRVHLRPRTVELYEYLLRLHACCLTSVRPP